MKKSPSNGTMYDEKKKCQQSTVRARRPAVPFTIRANSSSTTLMVLASFYAHQFGVNDRRFVCH